jgi:molecular chaperone GrpE
MDSEKPKAQTEAIVDEGAAPPSDKTAGAGNGEDAPADPLDQAKSEAAKLKDQLLRTAADFDNFRKRSRREVEDAKKSGREDLLRTVLPVFDNLERAVQSAQRATDVKAVAEGLSMVIRQFTDALGRAGIQKVPTIGQAFDPSVHEAIQQVETKDHPAGTVIAEVQPGYVQGERLIRAALVVVAKSPPSHEDAAGSSDAGGQASSN